MTDKSALSDDWDPPEHWDSNICEGADGLFAELAAAQPRLANQIERVKGEHPILCEQLDAVILGTAVGRLTVEQTRSDVLALLSAIAVHRQRGADLIYEGYCVDIGGG